MSLKVSIGGGGWTARSSSFFKHACMVYSKVSKKLKRYKRQRKNGRNIVDNIDNYSGFAPAGHNGANTATSRNVFQGKRYVCYISSGKQSTQKSMLVLEIKLKKRRGANGSARCFEHSINHHSSYLTSNTSFGQTANI